jgi:hypothetical protein
MNESSSDIDRRTEKPFDSKRIETDRRAHRIDDGVDGADFVEFDVLRLNVMDFAFRYRELRENVRCDALRIRVQLAVADHRQYFRRFPVKVGVVVVYTIVLVIMMMLRMIVLVFVGVLMLDLIGIMMVMVLASLMPFHDDIKLHGA